MNLIVAGLSHKTSPLAIREKLSFSEQDLRSSLQEIKSLSHVCEGIILSTCNRVEILFSALDEQEGVKEIKQFLARHHNVSSHEIERYLYFFEGKEAIRHVFRVASSLDSMVLGEPQILGQLKDAYRSAVESEATGSLINRFLHKAFSVAKRVRTETNIASSAVSVSFAAVELARKIFDNLEERKVLLIGAGETGELVTRHLISNGVQEVWVTNRTLERALSLARDFGCSAIAFDEIPDRILHTDIIISATSATDYIISHDHIVNALRLRKNLPLFMIDISVPRNLDPKINDLPNAYLYNIDDLEGIVESNKRKREKEAKKAEEIIDDEKEQFYRWMQQQEATPAIVRLREKVEHIRRQELEKTCSRWRGLEQEEKERLEALTSAIVNKILHDPIAYLKKEGSTNSLSVDKFRKVFNLSDDNS
jgi:glutamyl-tRNA reductase